MEGADTIQTIIARSGVNRILYLDLHQTKGGYLLSGSTSSPEPDESPGLVTFDQKPQADARVLIKDVLSKYNNFLRKHADKLVRLDNPCNAPFVSAAEQANICKELEISAEVRLNGKNVDQWWR